MAQKCQVCTHPKTKEIDRQIIDGMAHTKIAKQYPGLNNQNIRRHAENHLPKTLVKAAEKIEVQHSVDMLGRLNRMLDETERILQDGKKKGYANVQLSAIQQHNSTLELLAKMMLKVEELRSKQIEASSVDTRTDEIMDAAANFTINELKALEYLQCKASAYTDNWYDEPGSTIVQRFVDKYGEDPEDWPKLAFLFEGDEDKEQEVTYINKKQSDSNGSGNPKRRRIRLKQPKSTKKNRDVTQPDDSDDFDLELDQLDDFDDLDLDTKEPEWLEEERTRQIKHAYRPNFD